MSTKATKIPGRKYMALVRNYPLRPIRNRIELERANSALLKLAARPEGTLSRDEEDYLQALTILVRDAERQARRKLMLGVSPLQVLRHLMDEQQMNVNDLGRILGSQSTASMVLRGQRGISKAAMLRLAAHFRVSPLLFLQPQQNDYAISA